MSKSSSNFLLNTVASFTIVITFLIPILFIFSSIKPVFFSEISQAVILSASGFSAISKVLPPGAAQMSSTFAFCGSSAIFPMNCELSSWITKSPFSKLSKKFKLSSSSILRLSGNTVSVLTFTSSSVSFFTRSSLVSLFPLTLATMGCFFSKASKISSACTLPYSFIKCSVTSFGTEYFTSRYLIYSLSLSGRAMFSLFLAIFLSTPFTKPESPASPRFLASFTASFIAALSGTLSIKNI